jgi:hypothetical protein
MRPRPPHWRTARARLCRWATDAPQRGARNAHPTAAVPAPAATRARPPSDLRQYAERMPHALAHTFPPREGPHRGEHRGRVGALRAARAALPEPAASAHLLSHEVEQALLGSASDQTGANLGEHGVVAARVAQVQAARVLPIQPTAHRICRLPVRPVLQDLQHRDQGQAPRGLGGLSPAGEPVGEVYIAGDGAQCIAQLDDERPVRDAGSGNTGRLLGNGRTRQDLERPGAPPCSAVSRRPLAPHPTANPPCAACSFANSPPVSRLASSRRLQGMHLEEERRTASSCHPSSKQST